MMLRQFLNKKGQTSVEYLLLLVVSAGLAMTFYKKFNAYLIDNPNSYINTHLRFYRAQFDTQHGYKKFRLAR